MLKTGSIGADTGDMKCPTCRIRQLVVIELYVAGEPIRLHSCSHCDCRWWQGMDGSLTLASLLDLAAGER